MMKDKKYYNILWIDDEHEEQLGFVGQAKLNDIQFVAYKSLNSGMNELRKNYSIYDGVLLDAKFYEYEDDLEKSEDTEYVHRAKEELLSLPKKFEIFVLTGQAEAFEDKTFNKAFKKVYEKGSKKDWEMLFVDLKAAADKHEDTQTRHKYNRVFDVCTETYIGKTAGHNLLELLKYDGCETDKFNQIRKVIEDLFRTFNKYGLLPSEFVSFNVALNPASKFLCGQEQSQSTPDVFKKYKLNDEAVVPLQIRKYLKNILNVSQDGSHRSNVDEHVHDVKTPYLFKSVLFQLLDVLVWFKQYVDTKPKTHNWEIISDDNQQKENREWLEGEVINYNSDRGFAFLSPHDGPDNRYIPPHLVTKFSLTNGTKIKGEIEEYTDRNSGDLRIRVSDIVIIE